MSFLKFHVRLFFSNTTVVSISHETTRYCHSQSQTKRLSLRQIVISVSLATTCICTVDSSDANWMVLPVRSSVFNDVNGFTSIEISRSKLSARLRHVNFLSSENKFPVSFLKLFPLRSNISSESRFFNTFQNKSMPSISFRWEAFNIFRDNFVPHRSLITSHKSSLLLRLSDLKVNGKGTQSSSVVVIFVNPYHMDRDRVNTTKNTLVNSCPYFFSEHFSNTTIVSNVFT